MTVHCWCQFFVSRNRKKILIFCCGFILILKKENKKKLSELRRVNQQLGNIKPGTEPLSVHFMGKLIAEQWNLVWKSFILMMPAYLKDYKDHLSLFEPDVVLCSATPLQQKLFCLHIFRQAGLPQRVDCMALRWKIVEAI